MPIQGIKNFNVLLVTQWVTVMSSGLSRVRWLYARMQWVTFFLFGQSNRNEKCSFCRMSGLAGSSRVAKPVTKRNKKKENYRNRTSPKSDWQPVITATQTQLTNWKYSKLKSEKDTKRIFKTDRRKNKQRRENIIWIIKRKTKNLLASIWFSIQLTDSLVVTGIRRTRTCPSPEWQC